MGSNNLRSAGMDLTLYQTIKTFNNLWKKTFENNVGKGENAFSPFPTLHLLFKRKTSYFKNNYFTICQSFNLDSAKMLFGQEIIFCIVFQ